MPPCGIMPACVAAMPMAGEPSGLAVLGAPIVLASPKSRISTVPSGLGLGIAGFQIAMDDGLLTRGFQ